MSYCDLSEGDRRRRLDGLRERVCKLFQPGRDQSPNSPGDRRSSREQGVKRSMYIGYVMQQSAEIRRPPFDGPANHVRHVIHQLGSRAPRTRLAGLEGKIWRSDDLETFQPVSVRNTDLGAARLRRTRQSPHSICTAPALRRLV
jgi:hypothetical protein